MWIIIITSDISAVITMISSNVDRSLVFVYLRILMPYSVQLFVRSRAEVNQKFQGHHLSPEQEAVKEKKTCH